MGRISSIAFSLSHIFFSNLFLIFYKLYVSILFIGVTQQFSVCFHYGPSNASDAEARKAKLKDYGIARPICRPCIASGKEISARNAKRMRK